MSVECLEAEARKLIREKDFHGLPAVLAELSKLCPDKRARINEAVHVTAKYLRGIESFNRPSQEDYLHGAEGAVGCSREEEVQELTRASTAPTRRELERQKSAATERYLSIINQLLG